jgi:sulfur-oxidizing protein SoxA
MHNLARFSWLWSTALFAICAWADPVGSARQSSYALMSPENRAMQDDPSQNPATFWVLDGESLWQTASGKRQIACATCHGTEATSMKGVAASFPKFVGSALLNLSDQINVCRQTRQAGEPYAPESKPLLALTSYIGQQSKGLPIAIERTPVNALALEAGRTLFYERLGQLNLSCAQCHAERSGQKLGGNPIPQGHPTAYPLYRLEWQSVGSLQRRLRNCMTGVRAEPFALGSKELVELELFLMWRARGMLMETPGVRP